MSNALIDRLTDFFGPPERAGSVDAFIAEIARITAGFSTAAIDRAASALIADGGKSWPAPRDIVRACAEAQEALAMRGPPKMQNETLWERDARLADLWARDYCRTSELGERALNEGWGRQVHQWARSYACECYRHGKVPDTSARPTPAEIDHWFRHCRSPSWAMAHPDARQVRDWTDIDRHVVLGEAFQPETGVRLAAKIAQLKRMPVETAE